MNKGKDIGVTKGVGAICGSSPSRPPFQSGTRVVASDTLCSTTAHHVVVVVSCSVCNRHTFSSSPTWRVDVVRCMWLWLQGVHGLVEMVVQGEDGVAESEDGPDAFAYCSCLQVGRQALAGTSSGVGGSMAWMRVHIMI